MVHKHAPISVIKPLQLSPRETEVLMWTACGKTGGEIADLLAVSENTIRSHILNACRKLDATNKTHAASIALAHGILAPGPSPELLIPLSILFGLSRRPPELPRPTARKAKTAG